MRKLLTATALALAMAAVAPAFAQDFSGGWGTGNIARNVTPDNPRGVFRYRSTDRGGVRPRASSRNGYNAYASEPAPRFAPSYSTSQPSCAGDLGYGRADYSSC
jgi:hypothetical protein